MCEEVTVSRVRSARQAARGRPDRQHGRAGAHAAAVGLDATPGRRRVPRSAPARASARRPARRARPAAGAARARGGPAAASRSRECSTPRRKTRRGAARPHLVLGQLHDPLGRPERRRGLDRRAADLVERRRGGHAHVARLVEPGVHALGRRTTRRSSATASLEASSSARAGASPKRSRSAGADSHIDSQKPPLRPLGPWPQIPPSSRATRGARARADARPPTCRCSRRRSPPRRRRSSPSSGGRGSTFPASSSHQPVAV